MANNIWEPENIFDGTPSEDTVVSRATRWIDRDKPIIWWVCYRIAKSLNISVRWVRIIGLICLPLTGMAWAWLYMILALFTPYKDKKKTTWKIWSLIFEVTRALLWLFAISILAPLVWAVIVWGWFLLFTPVVDNQSIAALIPMYMYWVLGIISLALLLLFIGSVWALFKQKRIGKTVALLSTVAVIAGSIGAAWFVYQTAIQLHQNNIVTKQVYTLSWSQLSWNIINLDVAASEWKEFFDMPLMESRTKIVANEWKDITVEIESTLRATTKDQLQQLTSVYNQMWITWSNNTLSITSPENTFSSQVPFAFTDRVITISIPKDKEIVVDSDRYYIDELVRGYTEKDAQWNVWEVECTDYKHFIYNPQQDAFVCKNTTKMQLQTDTTESNYMEEYHDTVNGDNR